MSTTTNTTTNITAPIGAPLSRKSIYRAECMAWRNAIDRCTRKSHPQYKDYGARGIFVHPSFLGPNGFDAFLAAVGPKPSPELTLDRVNNSKSYEPGNLAWTSRTVQQRHRRKMSARCHDFGWGTGFYFVVTKQGVRRSLPSPLIPLGDRVQTLQEWAIELNIAHITLRRRFQSGKSPEEALSPILLNPQGKPRKRQNVTIH